MAKRQGRTRTDTDGHGPEPGTGGEGSGGPEPGASMVRPREIAAEIHVDRDGGINVRAQVSRELHQALMSEKGRRADRVTMEELVVEALVGRYLPE